MLRLPTEYEWAKANGYVIVIQDYIYNKPDGMPTSTWNTARAQYTKTELARGYKYIDSYTSTDITDMYLKWLQDNNYVSSSIPLLPVISTPLANKEWLVSQGYPEDLATYKLVPNISTWNWMPDILNGNVSYVQFAGNYTPMSLGTKGVQVEQLRQLLKFSGQSNVGSGFVYDETLENAVKQLKQRIINAGLVGEYYSTGISMDGTFQPFWWDRLMIYLKAHYNQETGEWDDTINKDDITHETDYGVTDDPIVTDKLTDGEIGSLTDPTKPPSDTLPLPIKPPSVTPPSITPPSISIGEIGSYDEDEDDNPASLNPHFRQFFDESNDKLFRQNKTQIKIVFGNKTITKTIHDVYMRSVSVEVDTSGNPIYEVYEFVAKDVTESDEKNDANKYIGTYVSGSSSDIKYDFSAYFDNDYKPDSTGTYNNSQYSNFSTAGNSGSSLLDSKPTKPTQIDPTSGELYNDSSHYNSSGWGASTGASALEYTGAGNVGTVPYDTDEWGRTAIAPVDTAWETYELQNFIVESELYKITYKYDTCEKFVEAVIRMCNKYNGDGKACRKDLSKREDEIGKVITGYINPQKATFQIGFCGF